MGMPNLPPAMSQLSRQCEILKISQPYRPSRPVTGIVFYFFIFIFFIHQLSFLRVNFHTIVTVPVFFVAVIFKALDPTSISGRPSALAGCNNKAFG
jgi:hypothetical protein